MAIIEQTDESLLRAWRLRRDADAFAEIVARHGGMVYAATLRVLSDPALAEDAAQECFVELMGALRRPPRKLAAWLHTVATRRAQDAARGRRRRTERERQFMRQQLPSVQPVWDDIRPHVDEAIAALPERLRQPIVLRFLEGLTYEKIGVQIGLTHPAVKGRIDQGVRQIRRRLAQKGLTIGAVALVALLEAAPTPALPSAAVAN